MQVNDIVQWNDNGEFGIVKFVGEEEALVNFLGNETFVDLRQLDICPPDFLDRLVHLYILQQYKSYQEAEVSAAFEINITTRAYASGRDGLEIKFMVGGYTNQVVTKGLATSTQVWLARETANVALAPRAMLV